MDDLESLRKYHEQVFRSFEDQLGGLIEFHQKSIESNREAFETNRKAFEANRQAHEESKLRMDRVESNIAQLGRNLANLTEYTRHAVELDIRAYRRERQRRREEIREAEARIAKQRAQDRAEWLERTERIERNLDRWIQSSNGRNPSKGPEPKPS